MTTEKIEENIKGKRGGKRPGSGRKKGVPNKTTRTIKQKAAEHGDNAITTLAAIMKDTENPPEVRIKAANSLLDRGFGKPPQYVEMDINPTGETLEERQRRELAYQRALENAAFDKNRMLERAKSI